MLPLLIAWNAFAGAVCEPLDGPPLTLAGRTFDGPAAFAAQVVRYVPGPGVSRAYGDPQRALGLPDFDDGTGAVSLGNRGDAPAEIVLAFVDAALTDGPGPDLYVFEAGPFAEAIEVAVSEDGREWHPLGVVEGTIVGLDLAGRVPRGSRFTMVRLRTASLLTARDPWAGPDVDAVGLLHACRLD